MIQTHSLRRAARYYSGRTAIVSGEMRPTFRELQDRVARIAAALKLTRFSSWRPVGHSACKWNRVHRTRVCGCSWLGVIVVPLNTRLSTSGIDRVLADASPRGLIRHSSLPVPNFHGLRGSWCLTKNNPYGKPWVAIPVLTPFTTRARSWLSSTRAAQPATPKALCRLHANILANIDHLNYWMPYGEGGVFLHAAPIFHISISVHVCSPGYGRVSSHYSQVQRPKLLRDGRTRTRNSNTDSAASDQFADPIRGPQEV